MPCFVECIQSRIDKATHGSQLLESFNMSNVFNHEYDLENMVLGRILMQDIHPEGFKQVTLIGPTYMDRELLYRLADLS